MRWLIENKTSGLVLGVFQAADERGALRAMMEDAGCPGQDPEDPSDFLVSHLTDEEAPRWEPGPKGWERREEEEPSA